MRMIDALPIAQRARDCIRENREGCDIWPAMEAEASNRTFWVWTTFFKVIRVVTITKGSDSEMGWYFGRLL